MARVRTRSYGDPIVQKLASRLWVSALLGFVCSCGSTDGSIKVPPSGPTPCSVYCDLMAVHCTRNQMQYPDFATCLSTCATFAVSADANDTQGDTLQCRMVYAISASTPERVIAFCVNAGPTGGTTCGAGAP